MSAQTITNQKSLELIVEADPEGHVAANVPVRWVISKEMAQELADKQAVEPYMLLVVTSGTTEMSRHLVPLKASMTYLQLHRPGTSTVHGAVVWRKDGFKPVSQTVMKKQDWGSYAMILTGVFNTATMDIDMEIEKIDEQYDDDLYWDDANARRKLDRQRKRLVDERERLKQEGEEVFRLKPNFRSIHTLGNDRVNIEVPADMFASEPPAWMKWLANLYRWPRSAQDQCSLRRRALITAFSLPFVLAVGAVVAVAFAAFYVLDKLFMLLATAVLLFWGMRKIDFSVLWTYNKLVPSELWGGVKPSIWWYKATSEGHWTRYTYRGPLFALINPPVVLGVFLLVYVLTPASAGQASVAALVVPAVIGMVLILVAKYLLRVNQKPGILTAEEKSKLERELALVTNGSVSHAARLSDLAPQQRTVRLRYLHIKAAVCKPFAK